jgi:hypothetical protein
MTKEQETRAGRLSRATGGGIYRSHRPACKREDDHKTYVLTSHMCCETMAVEVDAMRTWVDGLGIAVIVVTVFGFSAWAVLYMAQTVVR